MKNLLFVLLALFSFNILSAQTGKAPAEQNDPAAKKILDKIRKKYEGYKSLEASFALIIELPGQKQEVQKGTIAQDGDTKFRLEMNEQVIISDGKTTWVYLKKNNEVQINDADPKDLENGFLTPKDLLKRYQKGDYLYALTDKTTEGGKLLSHIEFKPKEKNSEYSKLRISIDEKASSIQSVKAFGKDGSRYTFAISKLTPNKQFAADHFTFDVKKYPGVKVEDLRM